MSQPKGSCPVCHEPLRDGDDIVTCPDCGAPYHRACYQRAGDCVFADEHGPGFEYKAAGTATDAAAAEEPPPESPASAGEQEVDEGETKGLLCPNCRTINDQNSIFCINCGVPLHPDAFSRGAGAGKNSAGGWNGGNGAGPYAPPFGSSVGQAGPAAYGPPPLDTAGEIDGISKRDWATFVGRSAATYLQRLTQMQQRKSKISMMLSAFFISPYYFAYRKLWAWAGVALFAEVLFMCPNVLMVLTDAKLIATVIPMQTLSTLDVIATYLSLTVRVLFCVFALYLYRRDAGKKINLLRGQNLGEAGYQAALAHKGGISVVGVVVVVALSFVLNLLPYFIFGYDYLAALYPGLLGML